jgi:predicted amino acid-binding ACT domain protein
MKLVVTVVGKDRVGIIAMVSQILAENNVNILSINQNILDGYFNMILMPLYFKEKLYGSVLYDLTDVSYRSGDFLANQYATVARVIDVLKHSDVQ